MNNIIFISCIDQYADGGFNTFSAKFDKCLTQLTVFGVRVFEIRTKIELFKIVIENIKQGMVNIVVLFSHGANKDDMLIQCKGEKFTNSDFLLLLNQIDLKSTEVIFEFGFCYSWLKYKKMNQIKDHFYGCKIVSHVGLLNTKQNNGELSLIFLLFLFRRTITYMHELKTNDFFGSMKAVKNKAWWYFLVGKEFLVDSHEKAILSVDVDFSMYKRTFIDMLRNNILGVKQLQALTPIIGYI